MEDFSRGVECRMPGRGHNAERLGICTQVLALNCPVARPMLYRYCVLFCLVWILGLAACQPSTQRANSPTGVSPLERFENVGPGADVDFVGDESCASCHEEEYYGYQDHGMANSVYVLSDSTAEATYPSETFYDEDQDFYYRAYRENGRFYQEEYRLNEAGEKSHRLVREMEFVVGSGSAAHTYLTEHGDRYYELPLTWYTQEGRWDFSPGYDTANNRFNRLIPDRCMACHNSYPESVPFVNGKYEDMPEGIGCERCHGPGGLHADERLVSMDAPDTIDFTIVNPAHLSMERRMDVCQQCHLHGTVSILREGRGPFDFRPGEPISAHVSIFSDDRASNDEADGIAVISHADRLQKSECFVVSRQTSRPMDCMTCHDPHEGFRSAGPEYFNSTCKDCHSTSDLRAEMIETDLVQEHESAANCVSCHMPKEQAEDAPHASFTDHWIRVVDDVSEERDDGSRSPSRDSFELTAYFSNDTSGVKGQRYRGIASVVYGTQENNRTALREGASLLRNSLEEESDHGEAYYQLGLARYELGHLQEAIPALERAAELDPEIPERLNALAQAYEAAGRDTSKIGALYRRALEIQPAVAEIRVNYGRFLEARGELDAARLQYEKVVDEHEWLAIGHYNLGTAYVREGRTQAAEEALLRAIELRPNYPEALTNLGALYANENRTQQARTYMERAVDAAPDHQDALNNLGVFYVRHEQPKNAVSILQRALEAAPDDPNILANLGLAYFRIEQYDRAREYARRALERSSSHELARQILQATAP
jgi:Tfp pilus assembly protein PilF